MAHGRVVGETGVEQLAAYLFDRHGSAAAGEDAFEAKLAGWLGASARFRAFVEANRDKIRKKIRTTPDPEARRDVRAELLVARLLVADKRLELAFEAYGSGNRGPDFTITFPGERPFNLEVTRPRGGAEAGYESQLLAKFRQLPTGAANAVLLAIDHGPADIATIESTVHALRSRADRRDDAYFQARGFPGAKGFYELFLRLGAVMVFAEGSAADARASLWLNRSARIALPDRPARSVVQALRA